MPRRARIEGPGLIHHVTGHSNPGVDAFPDDAAMRGFLSLLAGVVTELDWRIFAYCLLTTHYHLLLATERPNLGDGMRRLQGLHASRLNRRLARPGRLWRDRFHQRLVTSGAHVVRAAAYIDLNPVAAGLCSDAADWRWSSYRANAGLAEPPFWHRVDCLYGYMGAPPAEAPFVYRDAVAASVEVARARRTVDPGGLSPEGTVPSGAIEL